MQLRNLLVSIMLLIATVSAGSKDLCTAGSDSECARFGANMCCAYINYTFKGDNQEFYACASRPGIEYTNGNIFDKYGFSGQWRCADAYNMGLPVLALAASLVASLTF